MKIAQNVIGIWKFNGDLFDDALGNNFVLNNTDASSLGDTVSGSFDTFLRYSLFQSKNVSVKGLKLEDGVAYETDSAISNDSFTIAFWYNSSSVIGYTRNYITRDLEPKTTAIIGQGDRNADNVIENITNCSFVIREKTYSSTKNQISVLVSSNGSTTTEYLSDPYLPGLHLILLTYDMSNTRIRIDIDGTAGVWTALSSGINSSSASLKINILNPNYLQHQENTLARIVSELYIKNTHVNVDESVRFYTYGFDYITDGDLESVEFESFPILVEQPTTITTTKILPEGGNIYITRSDGSILKGVQNFWDTEMLFDSNKKNSLIKKNGAGTITFGSDGAKINGVVVTV